MLLYDVVVIRYNSISVSSLNDIGVNFFPFVNFPPVFNVVSGLRHVRNGMREDIVRKNNGEIDRKDTVGLLVCVCESGGMCVTFHSFCRQKSVLLRVQVDLHWTYARRFVLIHNMFASTQGSICL